MKPNLIVTSHGNLASEVVKSASMIVGEVANVSTVCMAAEDGLEGTTVKMKDAISKYAGKPIVILADLFGGTPFNVAMMLSKQQSNVKVVSGLNLGMVVEYAVSQLEDETELAQYLCTIGKAGIVVPQEDEEDDDLEIE
ncbi:PTS sugar transporter subunit IIA [[Eubacterium] hominis]|uniref:PTS sugar transporter subunit IIA n=1 Tax=[Eubacterium] hominis TaxID=2764325 RepID=UPI003A4DBC16